MSVALEPPENRIWKSRARPVKVLCLGMPRTGTESLSEALRKLGYRPYKVWDILETYKVSIPPWDAALDAKYKGIGKLPGRPEFDAMFGDFDSILDVPGILLSEELIRAYPEAKVVLTMRDETAWLRSMRSTLGEELSWWSYPYIWQFSPRSKSRVGFLWKCMECLCNKDFSEEGPAREAFRKQYDTVKKLVPPEQLLEFRSEDGWEPLCRLLNEKVPQEPYPRINDRGHLRNLLHSAYYLTLSVAVLKLSVYILISVLIGRYVRRRQAFLFSWLRNRRSPTSVTN